MQEESTRLQNSINAISDVNSLISRDIREVQIIKDHSIAANYRTDGCYDGDGNFIYYDSNYLTWELAALSYDYTIYFKPDMYTQICVFNDSFNASNFVKRYRTSDNNLPDASTPMLIKAGQVVAISASSKSTNLLVYTNYKANARLNDDISSSIKNDITNQLQNIMNDKIVESVFNESNGKELNALSEYDLVSEGYGSESGGITHMDVNSYTSYCLTISQDTELYFNSYSGTYFSIYTYDDSSYKNGKRYRKFQSEDNLPYKENPIPLKAGNYIIITVNTGLDFSVILSSYKYIKSFKESIPLADAHINQIKRQIKTNKCYLQYVGKAGTDNSTEYLRIFIPTGVGYVEYEFVHTISVSINSNIWRIAYAYACDSSFNRRFNLTTGGEWEIAIHLKDRSDFSGGRAHGDEILLDAVFFIDGNVVEISKYTDITEFTNFIVAESSNLFDPNDSSTIIAEHGSEHIFNIDGLKINQTLLWKVNAELQNGCYMAMHLPAKTVTDHMYTNADIKPTEITKYGVTYKNVNKAVVYGVESGVRTEFSVGEYPNIGSGYYFLLTDNGGGAYNKCYYVVLVSGDAKENDLWKSETMYKFDVNK